MGDTQVETSSFLLSREVITIQSFLEAAVRQETCGKVRIQRFIENLLRRIALAERLLEYYQENGSPPRRSDHQVHHLDMIMICSNNKLYVPEVVFFCQFVACG